MILTSQAPADRRDGLLTAGIALVVAITCGQAPQTWLGIRLLAAFRVGGGIVLLLMGIAMRHAPRGAIS
jgi:small neutral amino acid transporter SnatA (MarC family)